MGAQSESEGDRDVGVGVWGCEMQTEINPPSDC